MTRATPSKSVEAYEAIKGLVVERKLFPGQKIIYRELEAELGMSKTPIINGLMMLQQEGVVCVEKNRGFFMRPVSCDEAEQIYDLRERLEIIAAEYAIDNHQSDDIKLLEQKVRAYSNYQSPVYDRRRLEQDTAIHMQIAEMGRNDFFAAMIRRFYENIYFRLNVMALAPAVLQFKEEHEALVEAIRRRSLSETRRIIRTHTRAARKLMLAALKA